MRVYQTIAPQYNNTKLQYHFTIIHSLEDNHTLLGTIGKEISTLQGWHVCYTGAVLDSKKEMLVYDNFPT